MAYKIILDGSVQGVFCRYYCSQYAKRYKIHGSASNMRDGTVRLLLNTEDQNLVKEYITALQTNPVAVQFYGKITDIQIFDYSGPIQGDYVF